VNEGTLDVMEIGDKTHLICISIFIPSSFVSNKVINIPSASLHKIARRYFEG
jgi:hypothetical protein